jgi:hypothetical protein
MEQTGEPGLPATGSTGKAIDGLLSGGKELRLAPGRDGKPAASLWKFWVTNNEVYATSRSTGTSSHISVHASGQIHMRLGGKDLQPLAAPLVMGDGAWLHAFELRFLLGPGALRPPTENLNKKKAFLVDVPIDTVLILNLLVILDGSSVVTVVPRELQGARPIWRAALSGGRTALLVGRLLEMDEHNRDELRFLRQELGIKVNFARPSAAPRYIEIRRVSWSPEGGNVLLVVPMGEEGFRVEQPNPDQTSATAEPVALVLPVFVPNSTAAITAPNGAVVGTVNIDGANSYLRIIKNHRVSHTIGTVTLSIIADALVFGRSFTTPSALLVCQPSIDGGQPRNWEYRVRSRFDGAVLSSEIARVSTCLRNAILSTPMPHLKAEEELLLSAPVDGLTLAATASKVTSSAPLVASFLLRDA